MKKTKTSQILKLAKKYSSDGVSWHFHILSPGCKYNKNKKFALILEKANAKEQYIYLSLKRPSKTGQKLVEMLHGTGITKKEAKKAEGKSLSPRVMQMVERANELNNKGFSWHHHLFFPDCIFNKDGRYWTLVFEDPLNGVTIEEQSREEPKEALKKIEPLFYLQKVR